jgi:hypothetical protein
MNNHEEDCPFCKMVHSVFGSERYQYCADIQGKVAIETFRTIKDKFSELKAEAGAKFDRGEISKQELEQVTYFLDIGIIFSVTSVTSLAVTDPNVVKIHPVEMIGLVKDKLLITLAIEEQKANKLLNSNLN